ncbi:MAG: hypothetical protein ACU0B1_07245 [Thermohalobaculum sp.]
MQVFDDIERNLFRVAKTTDTKFGYLNLSARPEAERVRQLIEDWVFRYPDDHRNAMINRLRLHRDEMHSSAFFELALHELLIRTGHSIVAVEPKLEHTERSPDFLVECPKHGRFYLEAVVSTGLSVEERGAQKRSDGAVEVIEWAECPRYFLDLKVQGTPDRPVSLKALRDQLDKWIEGLPNGDTARCAAPFRYAEHGLELRVTAFARRKLAEPGDRAVGVRWGEPEIGIPGESIRNAVKDKASRYGELDAPYVVAVTSLKDGDIEEDTIDALIGSPCIRARRYPDGRFEHEEGRNRDGVWGDARTPRKMGLSAVLSVDRLTAWDVGQRRARLVKNPWALRPLPSIRIAVDEFNPSGGQFVRSEGSPLWDIFGLWEGWPET